MFAYSWRFFLLRPSCYGEHKSLERRPGSSFFLGSRCCFTEEMFASWLKTFFGYKIDEIGKKQWEVGQVLVLSAVGILRTIAWRISGWKQCRQLSVQS